MCDLVRIVLDPPGMRRAASQLDDAAVELGTTATRLAGSPLPAMPPSVGGMVADTITETSGKLRVGALELHDLAQELRMRARLGEIAGDGNGWPSVLRQSGAWLGHGLGVFGPGGFAPAVIAWRGGYRLVAGDRYTIVKGSRFLDEGLLSRYARSGRLSGTRYLSDNPEIARLVSPTKAATSGLADLLPTGSRFLTAAGHGSGVVAVGGVVAGDIYDFTAGPDRGQGLASRQFAATTSVDLATLGATTAIATSAGTATTAVVAGMAAGSVVPVVGTAAGLIVGGVIWWATSTSQGRLVRKEAINAVASGMKFAGQHPETLGTFGPGVYVLEHHGQLVHDAKTAGHDVAKDAGAVKSFVGRLVP
jgi:hypothetical protein